MKLLLLIQGILFLCFSSAYPQYSSPFSWFSNDGNANRWSASSTISDLGTNLLTNGADITKQVLETVSDYGKQGMDMAGNLGATALKAVNDLAETSKDAVSSGLTLGQELINSGTETFRSGRDAVLGVINQVIQGIENLASAVRKYFPNA